MREEFVFLLSEGQRMAGMMHVPAEVPAPAVVFCHGFTGNRIESHRLFVHAARELCRRGFVAFRFDFRGSGESDGLFQDMTITGEVRDLEAVMGWIASRKEVLADRIGVVGLSLGGVVSLLAAARDERIRALCLWSTPADLKDLLGAAQTVLGGRLEDLMKREYIDLPSGGRIGRRFLLDAMGHDILGSARRIPPRPLLIVHGTEDRLVPRSHARMLYEAVDGPKELLLIEGADHTFSRWEHQWRAIRGTAEWLGRVLAGKPTRRS